MAKAKLSKSLNPDRIYERHKIYKKMIIALDKLSGCAGSLESSKEFDANQKLIKDAKDYL